MARRRKKTQKTRKRNRGGRKPGSWELTTPQEILDFRKAHGLSRAKLADQLKVSTTSIQNWETGRVASRKIQERLRALMDGKPALKVGAGSSNPGPAGAERNSGDTAIATTGEIVAAYLRTQKGIKPDELTQLVRSVKRALSS